MKTKCPKCGGPDSWPHRKVRYRKDLPKREGHDEGKSPIMLDYIKGIHTENPAKYTPSQALYHQDQAKKDTAVGSVSKNSKKKQEQKLRRVGQKIR